MRKGRRGRRANQSGAKHVLKAIKQRVLAGYDFPVRFIQ
jgi:hypothetical protein